MTDDREQKTEIFDFAFWEIDLKIYILSLLPEIAPSNKAEPVV